LNYEGNQDDQITSGKNSMAPVGCLRMKSEPHVPDPEEELCEDERGDAEWTEP
jgi:hypothetical protein